MTPKDGTQMPTTGGHQLTAGKAGRKRPQTGVTQNPGMAATAQKLGKHGTMSGQKNQRTTMSISRKLWLPTKPPAPSSTLPGRPEVFILLAWSLLRTCFLRAKRARAREREGKVRERESLRASTNPDHHQHGRSRNRHFALMILPLHLPLTPEKVAKRVERAPTAATRRPKRVPTLFSRLKKMPRSPLLLLLQPRVLPLAEVPTAAAAAMKEVNRSSLRTSMARVFPLMRMPRLASTLMGLEHLFSTPLFLEVFLPTRWFLNFHLSFLSNWKLKKSPENLGKRKRKGKRRRKQRRRKRRHVNQ
jgi:hypothetical protein